MIKGTTVLLLERTQTGLDPFGAPVYTATAVPVEDVLVAPVSTEDVTNALTMYGKHAIYNLAIPKGDTHQWEDREVFFFGRKWRTFGVVIQGIEENIPLKWHKKVQVESYE